MRALLLGKSGRWRPLLLLALIAGLGGYFAVRQFPGLAGVPPVDAERVRILSETDGRSGIGTLLPDDASAGATFELFWQVWEIAQSRHYDAPRAAADLLSGALNGVLRYGYKDPFSFYLPPGVNPLLADQLEGRAGDTGLTLDNQPPYLIVTDVAPEQLQYGTILPGDTLLAIDGRTTQGMNLFDAELALYGPTGSVVALEIERVQADGEIIQESVSLTRTPADARTIVWDRVDDGLYHIRLRSFGQQTAKQWDNAADVIRGERPRGIILDLRGNNGGFIDAVPAIVGDFVAEGTAYSASWRDGSTTETPIEGRGRFRDIPLVVLVNGGTASAAEMVAGAIQEHGRARLAGTPSFGKGVILAFKQFDDPAAELPGILAISKATWRTPQGRSVTERPLAPDHQVVLEPSALRAGQDPVLAKAVELLGGRPESAGVSR